MFSPRRRRPSPSPVPLKELTPEPSEKESGELEEGEVNAGEVSSAPAGADRAPAAAPAAARAPATAPAPAAGGSAVGAARAPGRDAPKGPGEALPARRRPPSPSGRAEVGPRRSHLLRTLDMLAEDTKIPCKGADHDGSA